MDREIKFSQPRTADEIVAAVESGITIIIPADYAAVFMQECADHNINCQVCMEIGDGKCFIRKERRK